MHLSSKVPLPMSQDLKTELFKISVVQPIEAISPASIKANPNLDVEPISDPSTLDGPPGLSIGEKIHIVDTIKTSLSSQYNMETIELVNRSAVMSSLQTDACSYQRSMDKVIAKISISSSFYNVIYDKLSGPT